MSAGLRLTSDAWTARPQQKLRIGKNLCMRVITKHRYSALLSVDAHGIGFLRHGVAALPPADAEASRGAGIDELYIVLICCTSDAGRPTCWQSRVATDTSFTLPGSRDMNAVTDSVRIPSRAGSYVDWIKTLLRSVGTTCRMYSRCNSPDRVSW